MFVSDSVFNNEIENQLFVVMFCLWDTMRDLFVVSGVCVVLTIVVCFCFNETQDAAGPYCGPCCGPFCGAVY